MKRIRKGDEVIVIAGKEKNKGQRGVVRAVVGDRVIVEGINLVFKHVKPNPQLGVEGGIVEQESSIHISNVMLFNPTLGRGDKVGFKIENGKKLRVFKSNGEYVD